MLLAKVILVPTSYFSVKRAESYQFAPSYLLPPPSTLLGAFARGLFLLKRLSAPENEIEAKAIIITATVRALAPLARTGILLKRMRTLELRGEKGKSEQSKPRTDAMIREIVALPKMEAYYLLEEDRAVRTFDKEVDMELKRVLYSIDRLGDSESLVSVASVNINRVEATEPPSQLNVNTVLADDLVETVSGEYIHTTMTDLRDRRKPKGYYVPLSAVRERTDVYRPSMFSATPSKDTLMIEDGEIAILYDRGRQ